MLRIVLASAILALLAGCAEMMQTFNKDPVRVENVGKRKSDDVSVLSIASFDASRRNLMVVLTGPNEGRFCAAPPADVALNVESKTKAVGGGEAGTADAKSKVSIDAASEYKDTVTILAQRTVLLDIYRTGTYSLCQYYLNGAIERTDVSKQFFEFTQKVLDSYSRTAPSAVK